MVYYDIMSNIDELILAQSAMLSVLDEKLRDMPEWRAYRAIGKAIAALNGAVESSESVAAGIAPRLELQRQRTDLSYAKIAIQLLQQAERPMASRELIPAIAQRRGVDGSEKRVVISTALSRDERIKNIPWRNGTAWWLTDRELSQETARTNVNS
jgi:hypothetical protein